MCGKAGVEGCGSAYRHVEMITIDGPAWLPANLRAQAVSFPAMKWPGERGAEAGITMHLGNAHGVGMFRNQIGMRPMFGMIPVR